ncbi:MAG: ABC transporter substrate-binding protein [Cycloclasticus sp.]|nr:ABC transporter substrate-binding protein [Cycloclasticus sp.]
MNNRLMHMVLFSLAIIISPSTLAANISLIYDADSRYQQLFIKALSKQIINKPTLTLTTITTDKLSIPDLNNSAPNAIISLDKTASRKLLALKQNIPVFHALTTLSKAKQYASCLPNCLTSLPQHRFFILDQPAKRQIKLIQLIDSNIKDIGVIVTEQSSFFIQPLKKAIQQSSLNLNIHLTQASRVRYQIDDIARSSDIILAIPDSRVYNSSSLSQVLLTSYRYGTPVIGFSKGFMKAGAISGVTSSLDQLSQHLAESLIHIEPLAAHPHSFIYPRYFSVLSNRAVAKSLNLNFPSDLELASEIRADETDQ